MATRLASTSLNGPTRTAATGTATGTASSTAGIVVIVMSVLAAVLWNGSKADQTCYHCNSYCYYYPDDSERIQVPSDQKRAKRDISEWPALKRGGKATRLHCAAL